MPKIVDHDAYRLEIARKAAEVFSRYGYSNLGMRAIAEEIGISKSALYHYFESKEDLFAEATKVVLNFEGVFQEVEKLRDQPLRVRVNAYFDFFESLEPTFPSELSLLVDYLRGMTPEEVKNDPNMALSNNSFLKLAELFVGKKNAKAVHCLMQGLLLQRYFDGQQTSLREIREWVLKSLEERA